MDQNLPDNSLAQLQHFDDIRIRQDRGLVFVTLNRPAALNALTLEMVRALSGALRRWENDETVQAVIISGAGGRAFCAGGDIKAAYTTGMAYRRGETVPRTMALFFGEEYQMNRLLYHFKKPLIALMNGITMGGGYGIAGPCRYRVASEDTLCAMPETAIGFFPDVGSAAYLNKAPGAAGMYLGLSADHIGPSDSLYAGLATHYIPQDQQQDMIAALASALKGLAAQDQPDQIIADILDRYHEKPDQDGSGPLARHRDLIDEAFAGADVETICEALKSARQDIAQAQKIVALLDSRAPTSLKVTYEHLRRAGAQELDFDAVTAADFTLAQHFLMGHDFYEGVRAMVITKDRSPGWDPAHLRDVDDAMVAGYFEATGYELDDVVL